MWLLTTRGFYSVVEDHSDPDRVIVRARTRGDLESLRGVVSHVEIEETPERDYRFRASVHRVMWAAGVAELAMEIDYPNFKNAVAERQGSERAHLYSDVWATLLSLQEGGCSG